MPTVALLIRRYLRRSTLLIVVTLFGLMYLAFYESPSFNPADELDTVDLPEHYNDGTSLDRQRAYGLTELKQAMANRFGGQSVVHSSKHHGRQSKVSPRDKFTCDPCLSDPERCDIYGSRNVDLSRAFDGSGARIQRLLKKAKSGKPIKTAALGGSISIGAGCDCEPWHKLVHNWLNETFVDNEFTHSDGAVGARGSDYFKFCHQEHIDTDVDLVLMEMSVNDFRMGDEAFENFETLLRAVLSYPSHPAVIILQTFKLDGIIATGGDSEMTLAQYYDVPVISARTWILPMLMRNPEKMEKFYNYWIYEFGTNKVLDRKDLLHPNADGHKMMADTIIMYLNQQMCFLNNERPRIAPAASEHIPQDDFDMDVLPRMRLNRQFENTGEEPELKPKCSSLDTENSPLTPIPELTHGWDLWAMPGSNGRKKFWRGQKPGDHIAFELEIVTGYITAYFLKSAKWDLGCLDCWIDDDKGRTARLNGWWSNTQTVGEYQTIFDGGIKPGKRILHCEVLDWSENALKNERDTHNFLFIGLFSV